MLTLQDAYEALGQLLADGVDGYTPVTTRGNSPTGLEMAIEIRTTKTGTGQKVYFGLSKADRDRQIANTPTNQTESTTTMAQNNNAAFSSEDYVYGRAVSSATPAFLISSLNQVNNEIKGLQAVEATSTKIASMIEDLTWMKAKIVAALDAAK